MPRLDDVVPAVPRSLSLDVSQGAITMRTVRAVLVATAALAVVVTSGCGGGQNGAKPGASPATSSVTTKAPSPTPTPFLTGIGKLSASQIFARTKEALKSVDSVRITGKAAEDGVSMTMNLALTRSGGKSVITTGAERFTIIVVGHDFYLQGNDAFWKSAGGADGDALALRFRGKWLKSAAGGEQFGDLSKLADKDEFADELKAESKYWKTGPAIVRGVNCIGLRDQESVLWVDQATGRPIKSLTYGGKDVLLFTSYNQVPPPQAPPASLVIAQPNPG